MQRVPGALRTLAKSCAEANLPLFIINDPRVWGGNTHSDLKSAAEDLRRTLKARIVADALTIKEGKMFERGRLVGRMEAEGKWRVRDVGRRTREALQVASARVRKERGEDWSKLSSEELMQRLVDKKVVTVVNARKGGISDGVSDAEINTAFSELCRRYVANLPHKKPQEMESGTVESGIYDDVDAVNMSDSCAADAEIPS